MPECGQLYHAGTRGMPFERLVLMTLTNTLVANVVGRVLICGPALWVCVAAQEPLAQFSSSVQLVEVYATVTDAKGELVTGLRESDFDIFENSDVQEISTFAAGEFPLTVALGVDRIAIARGSDDAEGKVDVYVVAV